MPRELVSVSVGGMPPFQENTGEREATEGAD